MVDWESRLIAAKGLANMVSVAGRSLEGQGDGILAGGLLSLANMVNDEIDRAIDEVAAELSKSEGADRG